MSKHSYSRCWLHLIWSTLNHEKVLNKEACVKISHYLSEYTQSKGIYMKINYVNDDHIHTLIDLPTKFSIEEVAKLFKGSSSHWINQNKLVMGAFSWGRGYSAFSVSQSQIDKVAAYIVGQEEHHRHKTFTEEYEEFIRAYRLKHYND